MNNQDSLFALIKSLSIKESELFRQHSFPPNKRTQKAVQWQMFKLLYAMNSYQPEVLKRLFKEKDELKRQRLIGVNRFELKRKLLLFMGTLADEPILQRHNQIQALNTLYKKGLYYECHKQANLFKEKQKEVGQFSYASIANFYALMSVELSGEPNITDIIINYADEQVKLSEEIYANARMYRIYTKLYIMQLGGVLVTDKVSRLEIQKLESDPILTTNPNELSFNTRRYFFNSKAIIARLTGNTKDSVFFTEQEFYLVHNQTNGTQPTDELQSISDVIHSHILANNADKTKYWLEAFYACLKQHNLNPENYKYLTLHFELALDLLSYRQENKTTASIIAKENLRQKLANSERYYMNNFSNINIGIRKILEADLAMGYYEYGDLKKSLRYFDAFLELDINAEMGNRVKDIYCLFSLLVKYDLASSGDEKHNIESLTKECSKIRRKLLTKAMNYDISIELAFIDSFIAIGKNFAEKKKVSNSLRNLLDTLNSLKSHKLSCFNQLNNTFNLLDWVKKRI